MHEVGFSIPEIGALLKRQKLQFLGFEVGPHIRQLYAEFLGKDAAYRVRHVNSLEKWAAFEKENAMAFGAMYQFWAGAIDDAEGEAAEAEQAAVHQKEEAAGEEPQKKEEEEAVAGQ